MLWSRCQTACLSVVNGMAVRLGRGFLLLLVSVVEKKTPRLWRKWNGFH